MRNRAQIAAFALLAGFTARSGQAQAPEERKPEVVIPVTTELVNIDVVVTDKGGRPRLGLTQQDFTVLEDGQPQKLGPSGPLLAEPSTAVAPPAAPSSAPDEGEARPARAHPPRRFVVLVVDDIHLEAGGLM